MFDFFFFKQKTAYEMRISDWSSDVCSSDLGVDDTNKLISFRRMPLDCSGNKKPRRRLILRGFLSFLDCFGRILGGQRGIRTPDTLFTYTRFPGVRLQPLGHLS